MNTQDIARTLQGRISKRSAKITDYEQWSVVYKVGGKHRYYQDVKDTLKELRLHQAQDKKIFKALQQSAQNVIDTSAAFKVVCDYLAESMADEDF